MGQKTKYKDGVFEKVLMGLFAHKMEKFSGKLNKESKGKKKGLFDYDYDNFVDVSRRVMQGRKRVQEQEVVREVLLSMLPLRAPYQYFHPDHMSSAEKQKLELKSVRDKFKISESDCGSSRVQGV
ncbi:beta-carotene isomerase D27, chloroplastic [Tanacetum coccineum]